MGKTRTSSRLLIVALAVAVAGLIAAPRATEAAPAFPAFPRSTGAAETERWLASQTDLAPSSVVLIGPGYVFSFLAPDPPANTGGLVWRQVREEAVSAAMASRLDGRSASATIAFDCARNQATASNVLVYAGNSLQGGPGRSMPATDWLTANPGLYLMDLAQAACDPDFHPPFAGRSAPAPTPASKTGSAPAISRVATRPPRAETGPPHWVQVGAFANAAAANQRWRQIARLLPGQSAGRSLRLESAGRDGKTLVRALAGPFAGSAAQSFCAALKAHGGDCLVR